MKKVNSKGFTLIELLAVIVIMGILMMVAIPAVSKVIENARKDTFVDVAKYYANSAETLWTADGLACTKTGESTSVVSSALDDGDYYIFINTRENAAKNLPVLMEKNGKSSWGNRDVSGFVRVNVTTTTSGKRTTKYFVAISDGTHGILDDGLTSDSLRRGNVKMSLTTDDKKTVELTSDTDGSQKTTGTSPKVAITGTCIEN